MSRHDRVSIIARVGRFFVLRLRQVPIPFLGLVKMMTRPTAKSRFRDDKQLATVPDGTAKFKHVRSVVSVEIQWGTIMSIRSLRRRQVQLPQEWLNVGRPFCFKKHQFSRGRMFETQVGRVQSHSSNPAAVDDRRLSKRAAILDVAADRVAKFRELDTDLVGSSGFKPAFHFAVIPHFLKGFKVGDGLLAD